MKVRVYVEFDHDEIREKIPYLLVAETFSRGSRPTQTGRGKRLFKEMFPTSREQEHVRELVRIARSYTYLKGAPRELKMTTDTYDLWLKLAQYCMEV